MINNKEIIEKNRSLEKLKEACIKNYCSEIDFDNELDLYDNLIKHFVAGDLDEIYDNNNLKEFSNLQKKDILDKVHKYQNYCFYMNNSEYWVDSAYLLPVSDYNLITYHILDGFDFLIKLYLSCKEDGLKLLSIYNNNLDEEFTVVERARKSFVNDDVLINILSNVVDKESNYNIFTDQQLYTLLKYPEGLLYVYKDKGIDIINPLELGSKIATKLGDNLANSDVLEVETMKNIFKNTSHFNDVVEGMFIEYQNMLYESNEFINFYNNGDSKHTK